MLTLLLNTEHVYCCLSLCVRLEDRLVSDKQCQQGSLRDAEWRKTPVIQVAVKNRPEKAPKSILVIKKNGVKNTNCPIKKSENDGLLARRSYSESRAL